MVLYSIIMFLVAIPFYAVSIAIYRGKTHLICDYHQKNVSDPAAYGKAFGRAMLFLSTSLLSSGVISLFGHSETIAKISVSVLFLGLLIGILWIVAVQKKYNNGMF